MGNFWWQLPLLSFVVSALCAWLLHATRAHHGRWTADNAKGIQKLHQGQPPRVGLLPLLAGLLAAGLGWAWLGPAGNIDTPAAVAAEDANTLLALLLLCALPAAGLGLLEDITKRVRARWRLLGPMLGVGLAAWLLGAIIPRVGIPGLDSLVAYAPVGLAVTLLMVVGFTHAMNLVDGLNGLASGLAALMLAGTGWAAHSLGDAALAQVCAVMACAVLGFMMLNFPRGLVFLGDGGAYLLGFSLAVLWVLLLVRHPEGASPWFVMGLACHATMETIFSILRRKLRRRPKAATAPDRLHFHTLVLRRRVRARWAPLALRRRGPWLPNAVASSTVLACAALPMLLASARPASGAWGLAVCVLGVGLYLALYRHMVRWGRWWPGARRQPAPLPTWANTFTNTFSATVPAALGALPAAPRKARPGHSARAANDSVVPGSEPTRATAKL